MRTKTIVQKKVSPKVRILFVVDNSGSTQPYQMTLARGFEKFGSKYLTPDLDLAVATITTDTYLAGSGSASSKYGPNNGKCYSRLFPGIHDGPRPAVADGIGSAFTPGTCQLTTAALNQIKSNGKRSLRPILSTVPPSGTVANQAYIDQLVADFEKNVLPGTVGSGTERGFQSIHQFLKDNEERPECAQNPVTDPTCFFPHYDLATAIVPPVNVVVMVSDEHDLSQTDFGLPGGVVINHSASAISSMNDAKLLESSATLAKAMKKRLDSFFLGLQPAGATDPNYSVFAITNIVCDGNGPNGSGDCGLRFGRRGFSGSEPWGIEYVSLVDALAGYAGSPGRLAQPADTANSQAKYSAAYSILSADYDTLFGFIGTKIVNDTKYLDFTQFMLAHDIGMPANVTAVLILGDGTRMPVTPSWLTVAPPRMVEVSAQLLTLIPPGDINARIEIKYTPQ